MYQDYKTWEQTELARRGLLFENDVAKVRSNERFIIQLVKQPHESENRYAVLVLNKEDAESLTIISGVHLPAALRIADSFGGEA